MKTVLITGGSGGIGAATVKEFARAGYAVVFTYRSGKDRALSLAQELKGVAPVHPVYADVTDGESVSALFREFFALYSHLDVLVNCAGTSHTALLQDETEQTYRSVTDSNLKSAFLCSREGVSRMVEKKKGAIVNVSSVWGVTGGCMESLYSAAKAGVIGLTKALAKEVGLSGITVNAVAPGMIDTPMNAHYSREEVLSFVEGLAVPRVGTPEEVASVIRFLAEAPYVTGQVLAVDGGLCI